MSDELGQNTPKVATVTPAQLRFVAEWSVCRNVTEAAKRAKIPDRTARRWVTLPHVQAEMRAAWSGVLGQLAARMVGLSHKAVDLADQVLADETVKIDVRVSLVKTLLASTPGWVETHDLSERIAALEGREYERTK